jgi:hypothetical protein
VVARDDEPLRQFTAALLKIGQWVSAYRQCLGKAFDYNTRAARNDDMRLTALMTQVESTKRLVRLHLTMLIVDLLLVAVVLSLLFLPQFRV